MNEIRVAADIGYKEGFKAGAASRDAEVAKLKGQLNELAAQVHEAVRQRNQTRTELAAALAACKAKDAALRNNVCN